MRSWIASAVVVTPPSFLVPEGLVCDPLPNDMEMSPWLRTNRWQGMATASAFAPQACQIEAMSLSLCHHPIKALLPVRQLPFHGICSVFCQHSSLLAVNTLVPGKLAAYLLFTVVRFFHR
jgi:hypothetical protein